MIKRFLTISAVLTTAALTVAGGVALAQDGTHGHHKKRTHHAAGTHSGKRYSVHTGQSHRVQSGQRHGAQSGDQTAPETAGDTEQQGSAAPGGLADEPGNANENNQEEVEN